MKEIKRQEGKPGRKMKILTEQDCLAITEAAKSGLGIMDICNTLDISYDVWTRESKKPEIKDALKRGQSLGKKEIVNALFQNAAKGNTVAQIFWLKNKGGQGEWTDRQETEININLREILDNANARIQQNNNKNIIEGESIDITGLEDPGQHPKKKIQED